MGVVRGTVLSLVVVAALIGTAGCSPEEEPAEPAAGEAVSTEIGEPAAPTAPVAEDDPFATAFAEPIEAAHGAEAWRAAAAVSADVTVTFGGQTAVDGRFLVTPAVGRSRLELADGTVAVFDGERAWVSPASAELPQARFHLLTWPYFLAAPFKLRDPGTHLEDLGTRPLDGVEHPAARLTFDPGVGDSPDDWYVVYRDPETGRLAALAYVVTYGRTLEQAEGEPHAITYHDFETVGGATVPTTWRMWSWSEEEGVHGEPLGEVSLGDVRFVTPPAGAFDRPADAKEDPLPGG
jgi:hypothetical protein